MRAQAPSFAVDCIACPHGAECLGNALPPIARAGYGIFAQASSGEYIVYPCQGLGRCPGDSCDCIGGAHLSSDSTLGTRCAEGYRSDSPLCSLCEEGYGRTLGRCRKCTMAGSVYLLISVLAILLWFPFCKYVTDNFESVEITFNMLQFYGLYSGFGVEWPRALQGFFEGLLFFNLDVDMMALSCWNSLVTQESDSHPTCSVPPSELTRCAGSLVRDPMQ